MTHVFALRLAIVLFLSALLLLALAVGNRPDTGVAMWFAADVAVLATFVHLLWRWWRWRQGRTERPRPSRVSDPTQQGQPIQATATVGRDLYVPFRTPNDRIVVHSYRPGHGLAPIAANALPEPPRQLTVDGGSPERVHVLVGRTDVWVSPADATGHFTAVAFPHGTLLDETIAIAAAGADLFVLTRTGTSIQLFWRCGVEAPLQPIVSSPVGGTPRPLVAGRDADGVAIAAWVVESEGLVHVFAFRSDGRPLLRHAAAAIGEVAIAAGIVAFTRRAPGTEAFELWRNDAASEPGVDLGYRDACQLVATGRDLYAVVTDDGDGARVAWLRPGQAPLLLPFRGTSAASRVHGLAAARDGIVVLTNHVSQTWAWRRVTSELQPIGAPLPDLDRPRSLAALDDGLAFAAGDALIYCVSGQTNRLLPPRKERPSADSIPTLLVVDNTVAFLAKDNLGRGCLFASYLPANTGRTPK